MVSCESYFSLQEILSATSRKKNPADDQYCLACEIMLLSKDFITFPFVQCTFSAYPSAIQGRSKLKDEIIDITLKMPLS